MLPTLLAGGTGKLFFIKNVTRKTGRRAWYNVFMLQISLPLETEARSASGPTIAVKTWRFMRRVFSKTR